MITGTKMRPFKLKELYNLWDKLYDSQVGGIDSTGYSTARFAPKSQCHLVKEFSSLFVTPIPWLDIRKAQRVKPFPQLGVMSIIFAVLTNERFWATDLLVSLSTPKGP